MKNQISLASLLLAILIVSTPAALVGFPSSGLGEASDLEKVKEHGDATRITADRGGNTKSEISFQQQQRSDSEAAFEEPPASSAVSGAAQGGISQRRIDDATVEMIDTSKTLAARGSDAAATARKKMISTTGYVSVSWREATSSFEKSSEHRMKAVAALVEGKKSLAAQHTQIAALSQQAAGLRIKAANAYAAPAPKINEGNSWFWASQATQAGADGFARSIDFVNDYNDERAEESVTAAATFEQAAKQLARAAESFAADPDNKQKAGALLAGGRATQAMAIMLDGGVKQSEASRLGNEELAETYGAASEVASRAMELFERSKQCYEEKKEVEGYNLFWTSNNLLLQADATVKASIARMSGKKPLATEYDKVVKLYGSASQSYKKGGAAESCRWFFAAEQLLASAEAIAKSSATEDVELMVAYAEAGEKSEQASQWSQESVQAQQEGKKDKGNALYQAGTNMQEGANFLIKATEVRLAGDENLAEACTEIAEQLESAAEQYRDAAEAYDAKRDEDGARLVEASKATLLIAEQMMKAMEVAAVTVGEKAASAKPQRGLTNGLFDCFINSSLQLFKGLQLKPLETTPYLSKFLKEGLIPSDGLNLRQEMAQEVIGDNQDLAGVIINGTARTQQDAATFLRLLLEKAGAPEIHLTEKLINQSTGEVRLLPRVSKGLLLLPLTLPNPDEKGFFTMQEVMDKSLHSVVEDYRWNEKDLQSVATTTKESQFSEPLPKVLVVSLGRFGFSGHDFKRKDAIFGITDDITLPLSDGSGVVYEPTGIICHGGNVIGEGHYICYRKEENQWLLFNDDLLVGVPSSLENDSFSKENAYLISYQKTERKGAAAVNKKIDKIVLPPITEPSEADQLRWKARDKANSLAEEAIELAQQSAESLDGIKESYYDGIAASLSKQTREWCNQYHGVKKQMTALHKRAQRHRGLRNRTAAELETRQAESAWAQLVKKADGERVALGGVPYADDKTRLNAWEQADAVSCAAWEERCRMNEEEARAARVEKDWAANTLRWEARAEADRLINAFQKIETSEQLDSISLNAAKTAAKEAQPKWSRLADEEASVMAAQGRGKEAVKLAREKLKESDRAVNALKEEIENPSCVKKSDETPKEKEARVARETNAYKTDLVMKREMSLLDGFALADAARIKAQKKSRDGDDLITQAEAALFDEADQLEKNARQEYDKVAKGDALEAARKKITGAEAAWECRVERAIVDQQAAAMKAGRSSHEDEGNAQRMIQRMTCLAESDKAAFDIFKKEKLRLSDIEATWVSLMSADKQGPQKKKGFAELKREAKRVGEIAEAASTLPDKAVDSEKESSWTEAIAVALEAASAWGEVVDVCTHGLHRATSTSKTWWIAELEEAKNIRNRWAAKAEWREAHKVLTRAHLLSKQALKHPICAERISLWDETIAQFAGSEAAWKKAEMVFQYGFDQAAERFKTWWPSEMETTKDTQRKSVAYRRRSEADRLESLSGVASDKAFDHPPVAERTSLWEESIATTVEAAIVFEEAVAVFKMGSAQAAKKSKKWWIDETQITEAAREQCVATITWREASKVASLAGIASNKAFNHPVVAERTALWDEAIAKSAEAIGAWEEASVVYQEGLHQAAEKSKNWWIGNLEVIAQQKMEWAAMMQRDKGCRADGIFATVEEKISTAPLAEKTELYSELIAKISEAIGVWEKTVSLYKEGHAQSSKKYKAWWSTQIEAKEYVTAETIANMKGKEALKANLIVGNFERQAVAAPVGAAQTLLWEKTKTQVLESIRAYEEAIKNYQAAWNQTAERFKEKWITTIESGENVRDSWISRISWYEAYRVASIATAACDQAAAHPGDQVLINQAEERAREAAQAWSATVEVYRAYRDGARPTVTAWWNTELEKAEKEKALWDAKLLR